MDHQRYERRIRALEAFGHRGSCSDNERRAAEYLAAELRQLGIAAELEEFRGARSLPGRMLVHVILAAIGSALMWRAPLATVALVVVAVASFMVEQTKVIALLSWPLCRRRSQNVCGEIPAAGETRGRIVLCAHYDTQHSGIVWAINEYFSRRSFDGPLWLEPPMTPVIGFMLGSALIALLRLTIGPAILLTILNFVLLAIYTIVIVLFTQWAFGRCVPGAADNASGVAAVLELAEAWRQSQPADDITLTILLPGCEESGMLGAAAWIGRHRPQLQSPPALFLNIDGIGFGPPRFLGTEVPIAGLPIRSDAKVVELCSDIARQMALNDAGPHILPTTDGLAFLARGIRGVTIVGFQPGGVLPHYHTMADTTSNVDFTAAQIGVEFAQRVCWKMPSRFAGSPP